MNQLRTIGVRRIIIGTAALALLTATGCGSGKTKSGSNFANPPAASQYNNYAGTQTYQLASNGTDETGGVWNITLDDTNRFFTYTDVSIPPISHTGGQEPYPIEGTTKSASGFLDLTLNGKNSGSGGYAIEIPGRLTVLRPGDTSTLPVIAPAASTSHCQALPQNTTFSFLTLEVQLYSPAPVYAAYGSIEASSSGTAWTFSNLQMFTQDGAALNPPTPSSGLCSYTKEGYVTTILSSTATQNVPWTVVVGPTGYLAIDQGQGDGSSDSVGALSPTGAFGLVGFPQPTSQIDTNKLVAVSYVGFTYDNYAGYIARPVTQPIAFAAGSGTVATGGLYPNDDVTQTPPADITMDLGPQDPKTNGLYKSVTVTMPDVFNGCVDQTYGGTDANGNPTCIAHGMAIAGQAEGKYVLYVSLQDRSLETRNITGAALEYFLYQQ